MSGVEYVDIGGEDQAVIGLKVSGRVEADDIAGLVARLEDVKTAGHKARLYLNLSEYQGGDMMPVAKEKLAHMSTFWTSIDRCAYVLDEGWMSTAIGLIDAVTPMHLRAFGLDQDDEARAWVKQAT